MHYILDTSAVMSNLSLLSNADARQLVIPREVLQEISKSYKLGDIRTLRPIIEKGKKNGLRIEENPSNDAVDRVMRENCGNLDYTDSAVLAIAANWKEGPVTVVTEDWFLARALQEANIKFIKTKVFISTFKILPQDELVESKTTELKENQPQYVMRTLVFVVVAVCADYNIFINKDFILSIPSKYIDYVGYGLLCTAGLLGFLLEKKIHRVLHVFGVLNVISISAFEYARVGNVTDLERLKEFFHYLSLIVLIAVIGLAFFWLRQNYRILYGLFESMVGASASFQVFFTHKTGSGIETIQIIQFLAGLYIIVRGLDNIGNSLENTIYGAAWARIFTRRRKRDSQR